MPDPLLLEVVALQGIPEVSEGDDLARLLLDSAGAMRAGDILVVSSKVVSKALGLTAPSPQRAAVVDAETVRVVAARRTPRGAARIVESVAGPVMAAAGVDASNTAAGTILVLPRDCDAVARELRASLRALGAPSIAVVISDTAGRAWRTGQTDFALGCAGLIVSQDLRGTLDASGTVLEVTERAIADQVAAAADLVKGKASGVPAALVRGLADLVTDHDGPGAAALLRPASGDWFRLGHVEAVRAALGLHTDTVEAPSVAPEPLLHKARRALQVASYGHVDVACEVRETGARCEVVVTGDPFGCGMLTARLQAALWAEDLAGTVTRDEVTSAIKVSVCDAQHH